MLTDAQLNLWQHHLSSSAPILGWLRRRRAIAAIEGQPDEPQVVPLLVEAAASSDARVAARAAQALQKITAPAAVEALCTAAIHDPNGIAGRTALDRQLRPADHERLCLFLFVTRQLDDYFREDFEFQSLRLEYERAGAVVRENVMAVVRSGDRRCASFIGTRKPLADCSAQEIQLALESWRRHGEWPRYFQACLELPLQHSLTAWPALRGSGWAPDDAALASVLREVLTHAQRAEPTQPQPARQHSSLFESWLARGATAELAGLDAPALLQRLQSATPPDAVSIVAALARKSSDTTVQQAVAASPHWLVRLAGQITGLVADPAASDSNYWVSEIGAGAAVFNFWPTRGTPTDLERLSQLPAEAFLGKLGAARQVLRAILAYRVTAPSIEAVLVEASEFVPEVAAFEEADA